MIAVDGFEANTRFSALLERVAEGEEVLIIKHGRAVVRIVAASGVDRVRTRKAIALSDATPKAGVCAASRYAECAGTSEPDFPAAGAG